jgi:hypothetical protein
MGHHHVVFGLGDGFGIDNLAVGVSNDLTIEFAKVFRNEIVENPRVSQRFDFVSEQHVDNNHGSCANGTT